MPGTVEFRTNNTGRIGAVNAPATIARVDSLSTNALLMQNNMDLSCLRTHEILNEREWTQIDTAVKETMGARLVGIEDLRSRGLVADLGDMGTLVSAYERGSEMNEAEISMWAHMDAEQAQSTGDLVSVPVPVIFKEFQINLRRLLWSRRTGESIDTTNSRRAARSVAEKLESLLFNGNTTVYGSMPIYGYRTHPSRNTGSGSDFGTATNIYPVITEMVGKLLDDNVVGPYLLYLNRSQYVQTLAISDTTRQLSERQVAINSIPELEDIKSSSNVPDGEAVLVAMNAETVDLGIAEDVVTVQWTSLGGMTQHFRTMFCGVPRIKADFSGQCGVCHYTGI